MKRKNLFLVCVMLLLMTLNCYGQTNMVGRIYYHPNIMAAEINKNLKEFDQKLAKHKAEAVAKVEKEKGRKMTAEEVAELEKDMKEGRIKAHAAFKAMSMAVTIEFISATQAVMKADMKVDDAALKTVGVSWLKRKAMKAAMAVIPKSNKDTYVVKGNQIFFGKGKDQEIMTLSADGKTISGKWDDQPFTLTRTK